MNFEIHQLPLWEDNYIYILHEKKANKVAVIDPGEAQCVQHFLKLKNLKLNYILNTHHHFDHTGGNLELKKFWGCKVYGFKEDQSRIPGIDIVLQEGEEVLIGKMSFEVLFLPGHTLGHIAFWNSQNQILFCGDTLFAMGCGRLFEGTPTQMFSSLQKIKKLPKTSLIYCAHEYSLKNAHFALSLSKEASHSEIKKRFTKIKALRKKNQSTVPFYLEEELLTNPFLRAKSIEDFAHIRKQRDHF